MTRRCALIPGASGVVGLPLARYLAATGEWDVIGLARRPPAEHAGFSVIAVDLDDAAACRAKLGSLAQVTHIIYSARATHAASKKEPIEENLTMLRNVVDAVEPVAKGLVHVHLVQGSKYYGSDLGPYKTPAKETDPRIVEPNWYYAQEDFVIERSRGKAWSWSASRPHGISDPDLGITRSIARVVAIYAAICKELGEPLYFPGTPENFRALYQCTEATLLAKGIAWMSTTPACANEPFNIINGDFIRWVNLWPNFARFFGMEPGPVRTVRLAEMMADKAPVWERIVKKHGLVQTPWAQTALWPYGDFIFRPHWDIMSDTLKLRRSGFHEAIDTEQMFLDLFRHFREQRVIP
jgi:nucleoside-diphosphate-sugar epimerase